MVKIIRFSQLPALGLMIIGEIGWASTSPAPVPSPTLYEQSSQATAAGKSLGGTFQTGVKAASSSSSQQVIANVLLTILGLGMQALQASSSPPNTIDGTTYTEFYSFGKRVFSQSAFVNFNGNMNFSVGLAPTQIRVPLFVYPVGPVALTIDGGVRFQADVQGSLVPVIGIPLSLSSLGVQLEAMADGAGFIEGYANFLVVRAGVGGQVDLVDASANLNARLAFDGSPPFVGISAMVDFLKGRFYAFLDYFNPLRFGYQRLLDYSIYSWKGYCYDTGAMLCP